MLKNLKIPKLNLLLLNSMHRGYMQFTTIFNYAIKGKLSPHFVQ